MKWKKGQSSDSDAAETERERHEAREQRHEEEDALQRSLRVSRSQFGQSSSVSEFDRAVAASLA